MEGRFSNSTLLNKKFTWRIRSITVLQLTPFGVIWRTGFICASTGGQASRALTCCIMMNDHCLLCHPFVGMHFKPAAACMRCMSTACLTMALQMINLQAALSMTTITICCKAASRPKASVNQGWISFTSVAVHSPCNHALCEHIFMIMLMAMQLPVWLCGWCQPLHPAARCMFARLKQGSMCAVCCPEFRGCAVLC